jgi:hypothetical protein
VVAADDEVGDPKDVTVLRRIPRTAAYGGLPPRGQVNGRGKRKVTARPIALRPG